MTASERLTWAAGVVAPRPAERILEVGCGHGVLVSLLADRLTAGSVLGVDRSPTMIAAAARRNRVAVDAGRVHLLTAALVDADLGDREFDVVVSFDVRAFWTPPAREWDVVDRVLASSGRVLVGLSLMDGELPHVVEDGVRRLAGDRDLEVSAVHRGATSPFASAALELRRRSGLRSRSAARRGAGSAG